MNPQSLCRTLLPRGLSGTKERKPLLRSSLRKAQHESCSQKIISIYFGVLETLLSSLTPPGQTQDNWVTGHICSKLILFFIFPVSSAFISLLGSLNYQHLYGNESKEEKPAEKVECCNLRYDLIKQVRSCRRCFSPAS